ncbi:MAG: protocatechuate 3,4-dioxygenase beta subunit [Planctomycetota bacterium]|jgi:protocatechuate 3,4-dioxygenase beta subunit
MKQSHILSAMAIAIVGGALWLASGLLDSQDPANEASLASTPDQAIQPLHAPDLEELETNADAEAAVQRIVAEVAPVIEAAQGLWAGQLGGLIGRVVEEDKTPIVGISVALIQADANLLLAGDFAAMGEEEINLVLQEAETDEEGRFRLDGAYDGSFQGLGIDLRGERSTVRVVDSQLHHGEVTDLGDIVLATGCIVIGRVTDESGNAVEGVRVRIAPLPPEAEGEIQRVLEVGIQDFRSDCAVAITSMILNGGGSPVIEPPPIIRRHLDDFPIPTTLTNADGEYRFEAAPIGKLLVGIDLAGWLGSIEQVETQAGENELEANVLRAGKTVSGIVIDEEGEPVAGVEVMAGTEVSFGEAGILHPAGFSDSEGEFSLTGCPMNDTVIACARRGKDEPWVGAVAGPNEELEIEISVALKMLVRVVDLAGEPVEGARIELSPAFDTDTPMRFLGRFMKLGAKPLPTRFIEGKDGTYSCDEVSPGSYIVVAQKAGLSTAEAEFELKPDVTEVTLTCAGGTTLELTVLDHHTREPIGNARASIVSSTQFGMMTALAVGRTSKEGVTKLGPYEINEENYGGSFGSVNGHNILVQHPGYADAQLELVDGMQLAEISLRRGAEISGNVVWGSQPPQEIYMIMLENREGVDGLLEAFAPPRIGRTGLTGEFKFTNLQPGKYRVGVYERFFDRDPLTLMMTQTEPTMVHREEDVFVEEAGKTEIMIDLSPSGRGQTSQLTGTVFLDGSPVVGASVRASGRGSQGKGTTDHNGEFTTKGFVPNDNETYVRINADLENSEGQIENAQLYSQSIKIEAQSMHRIDLDLQRKQIQVRVTSADGSPIEGAKIRAESRSGGWNRSNSRKTDVSGEVDLMVFDSQKYSVTAEAAGFAKNSTEIDLENASFNGTVDLELHSSTPCAGTCDLTALDYQNLSNAYLRINGPSTSEWKSLDQSDVRDDGFASFTADNLMPGEYKASFWVGGTAGEDIPFTLPEGGDTNLLIVFQLKTE